MKHSWGYLETGHVSHPSDTTPFLDSQSASHLSWAHSPADLWLITGAGPDQPVWRMLVEVDCRPWVVGVVWVQVYFLLDILNFKSENHMRDSWDKMLLGQSTYLKMSFLKTILYEFLNKYTLPSHCDPLRCHPLPIASHWAVIGCTT